MTQKCVHPDPTPAAESPGTTAPPPKADMSSRTADGRLLSHSVRALRNRDFALFWSGALVSNTGNWLSNLTVPYVLFQLTGSALWTGLASLAQFAPQMLLTPLAGTLADRLDRRRFLVLTQVLMALAALGLWATWMFIAQPRSDAYALLALVAVSGVLQGLNLPSWQAFVNDLVPRTDLRSAITLNSVQFNASRSLGPAIAGAILAAFGPSVAFAVNAGSFVFVIIALLAVRLRLARPARRPRKETGFLPALAYVRREPGIMMAIGISFLIGVLANPILQFSVIFAETVFRVGPVSLGLLNASFGLGSVLAAPLIAGSVWRRASITRVGLLMQGGGLLTFALAPNVYVAMAALLVMGAGFLASISCAITALQMIVTEAFRGRVIAVRIMIYSASFPIGALIQTALADQLGPRPVVSVAGALLIATGLLVTWGRPARALARLDDDNGDAV
ncbi:MAG: MFS transporter [Propionibacteriaceae bacterium]|nr:MFS transporter [Propionibacteriaceae bacterium]